VASTCSWPMRNLSGDSFSSNEVTIRSREPRSRSAARATSDGSSGANAPASVLTNVGATTNNAATGCSQPSGINRATARRAVAKPAPAANAVMPQRRPLRRRIRRVTGASQPRSRSSVIRSYQERTWARVAASGLRQEGSSLR
jgi:hypothetical protein